MGLLLSQGQKSLLPERKEAICRIAPPSNRRQLRSFIGMANFCRQWVHGFAALAQPLYDALSGGENDSFTWSADCPSAFMKIKAALASAPALGLPDYNKVFYLFASESQGRASGILTQTLGKDHRPIAYFSSKLDGVAQGWPPCLRALAAAAVIWEEALKFTLGSQTKLYVPHSVLTLLENRANQWLTPARMAKYQAIFIKSPELSIHHCTALNPATLLLQNMSEPDLPLHDCQQFLDYHCSARPDLTDIPLSDADLTFYTDGSSFMDNGVRRAGYAVVTIHATVEANSLPPGTSAQLAELIALTRALQLAQDQKVNIFTDSKYSFSVVHAHTTIWRERGLITTDGSPIKHGGQILGLLDAILLPSKVAVMHCPGHQRKDTEIAQGNTRADHTAKTAALLPPPPTVTMLPLIPAFPLLQPQDHPFPMTGEDVSTLNNLLQNPEWTQTENGAVHTSGQQFFSYGTTMALVKQAHLTTHLGRDRLYELLVTYFYHPQLRAMVATTVNACVVCIKNNPAPPRRARPRGLLRTGTAPGDSWQLDFTDMPRAGMYKYLLLFIDNFTGRSEGFACKTNKTKEVTKRLLQDIIPRFSLPRHLDSDQGPYFTSTVMQEVATALGISYHLHMAWHPTSSGRVEASNWILKTHLRKICQELSLKWPDALPLALFRMRITPRGRSGLSPFEALYGRVCSLNPLSADVSDLHVRGEELLKQHVVGIAAASSSLSSHLQATQRPPLEGPQHPFQPGDQVYLEKWQKPNLEPRWTGPFTVLLVTQTAVRLSGSRTWTHHTLVRFAPTPAEEPEDNNNWAVTKRGDLRLTLCKQPPPKPPPEPLSLEDTLAVWEAMDEGHF
ncbi:protein NYNRIN-like isoform X1 [Hemicordylus capensis]|uniref:protein NYNRIN-like isoform X1 n=1 Tax=Hemicordylus capensis TaxID=884348 RepID=UPI00230303D7|nr:protein NYNRIN-like isoform X1 [Hemicordylus capensis]